MSCRRAEMHTHHRSWPGSTGYEDAFQRSQACAGTRSGRGCAQTRDRSETRVLEKGIGSHPCEGRGDDLPREAIRSLLFGPRPRSHRRNVKDRFVGKTTGMGIGSCLADPGQCHLPIELFPIRRLGRPDYVGHDLRHPEHTQNDQRPGRSLHGPPNTEVPRTNELGDDGTGSVHPGPSPGWSSKVSGVVDLDPRSGSTDGADEPGKDLLPWIRATTMWQGYGGCGITRSDQQPKPELFRPAGGPSDQRRSSGSSDRSPRWCRPRSGASTTPNARTLRDRLADPIREDFNHPGCFLDGVAASKNQRAQMTLAPEANAASAAIKIPSI